MWFSHHLGRRRSGPRPASAAIAASIRRRSPMEWPREQVPTRTLAARLATARDLGLQIRFDSRFLSDCVARGRLDSPHRFRRRGRGQFPGRHRRDNFRIERRIGRGRGAHRACRNRAIARECRRIIIPSAIFGSVASASIVCIHQRTAIIIEGLPNGIGTAIGRSLRRT